MADGGLTLHLDEALSDRLRLAAEMSGEDINAYAARAIDFAIGPERDWAIDEAIADDTLANGTGIPLASFLDRLDTFGGSAA